VTKESELEPFHVEGYPSAFLIDGTGKILWEGHPAMMTAAALQSALKSLDRVTIGAVAPALAPAKADFEKGKFADASKKAQTVQAGKSASDAEKADAQTVLDAVQKLAEAKLKRADEAAEGHDYPAALELLKYVQDHFKGLEAEKTARDKEKELRAKPEVKKELEAAAALDRLMKQEAALRKARDKRGLIPVYEALAKKYEGTLAARQAGQRAQALSKLTD
jgi:hypothetical protein